MHTHIYILAYTLNDILFEENQAWLSYTRVRFNILWSVLLQCNIQPFARYISVIILPK